MGRWTWKGKRVTHAEIRAGQRYGEDLGWAGMVEVRNLIGTKQSMLVCARGAVETWDVYYRGQIMRLVYDPRNRALVTFLPPVRRGVRPGPPPTILQRIELAVTAIMDAFSPVKP